MRTVICLSLVLMTGAAHAGTIFMRSFSAFDYPELPNPINGTLRLEIHSEGSESFVFETPIPVFDGCCFESLTITPATAPSHGLDWAALEAIVTGPADKSTDFGPVGLTEFSPYLRSPAQGGGYLEDVTLSSLSFLFDGADRWVSVSVSASGTYTILAPEPTSIWPLVLCSCFVLHGIRARKVRPPLVDSTCRQ